MARKTIEDLLARRIGLDPATVGDGLIARALNARMTALGLGLEEDYARRLVGSDAEQEALIETVVVPESWFFRDERPFQVLRDEVRARVLGAPEGSTLRVLSIPCAGGEEPYSIAITLHDLGLTPERTMIDAVDVSAGALERAARGVYRANAFRGENRTFLARHFHDHPEGSAIDPAIRSMVRFLRGNLIDPDLLRDATPYDVIFCRNLLIYLDVSARRQALETLDRLLAPGGLLFLGHAELPSGGRARFEAFGEKGGFAYRRATEAARPPETLAIPLPAVRPGRPTRPAPPKRGPAPTPKLSSLPRVDPPRPPASLEEAAALAGQAQNDRAAALCERSIREDGPSARAYFLLGMIRQAQDNPREAEACLQKVVYLDPQHDEALLALALLAARRGDESSASGYRRRAARVHRRNETP